MRKYDPECIKVGFSAAGGDVASWPVQCVFGKVVLGSLGVKHPADSTFSSVQMIIIIMNFGVKICW